MQAFQKFSSVRNTLRSVAALIVLSSLGACAANGPTNANASMLNEKCPMQPQCGQALKTTADYKGGKVGFCCAGCVGEWNKLDESQKAERLAAVKR